MAVHPDFQRCGIGSLLMSEFCTASHVSRKAAIVMSSPEGMGLYVKFGFWQVGEVDTGYGSIFTMIRAAEEYHGTMGWSRYM